MAVASVTFQAMLSPSENVVFTPVSVTALLPTTRSAPKETSATTGAAVGTKTTGVAVTSGAGEGVPVGAAVGEETVGVAARAAVLSTGGRVG
jgi:hypothetical protein